MLAGVIDQDYRGNVGVVMFNHSQTTFKVNKGDRVAQLICEQIFYPEIEEVEVRIMKTYCCCKLSFSFFNRHWTPQKGVKEDLAQLVRTETLITPV